MTLELLKSSLAPIYNPNRRFSYSEECLLLALMREPTHEEEVAQVLSYFNGLTAAQRKYFPQTMERLLTDWLGILDKAAMHNKIDHKAISATAESIKDQVSLKRIEARMAAIKAHYAEHNDWIEAHRVEYNGLIAVKKVTLKRLGMVV